MALFMVFNLWIGLGFALSLVQGPAEKPDDS